MRLKTKVIGLLLLGFTLLFASMAATSFISLKRNQEENLQAFRNEFSEASLELLENNANLFFMYLEAQMAVGDISRQQEIISFLNKLNPENRYVMAFDLQTKQITYSGNYASPDFMVDQGAIALAFNNWTLNKGTRFEFDNFNAFAKGSSDLVPTKLHFRVYENYGLMIVYGKSFYVGKIRMQYLESRNKKLYERGLAYTVLVFIFSLVLISTISIAALRRTIIAPILAIHDGLRKIQMGDLSHQLNVLTRDEFGELSKIFNETANKLSRAQHEMSQLLHERTQAKEQALQLLSQNRELTQRLFKAQESERGRLAQELHDELGQWLTAVNLYAQAIANLAKNKSSEIYASATKITNSTTQMHNVIRSIIHKLRPQILDELGLRGGLHELVSQWQLLHPDIICELAIHYELDKLGETAKITIYRIVQEGLTNAAKYAQANNVSIQLHGEQSNDAPYLILTIKDDGKGIDLSIPNEGMGLAGMRERALAARGEFLLTSEPGKGTHIEVRLPVESGEC